MHWLLKTATIEYEDLRMRHKVDQAGINENENLSYWQNTHVQTKCDDVPHVQKITTH